MRNLDNPIEFARHRRRSATSGEFLMWQILRNRQRCKMKFRREHPLGPYTCDFYCAEAKLDIECDGKDHFTDEGKAKDAIRDTWMKRQGITTLRFTNQQIENDTQTVLKIIDGKLLELASPSPPNPLSPKTGRGGGRNRSALEDGVMGTKNTKNAFTLIELLVTLVIVSVLAAATLPAFKNVIVERKTSVAALEVKAFLDAARARAIARGRPVSVILERLSSRTDGFGIDGTAAITTTNPVRSITAQNPPAPLTLPWTPGDIATNFDVYNTCIRMVMAESLRPIEFELGAGFLSETASGVPTTMNDGDGLVELGRVLIIPNSDNRLDANLQIGNEIEILSSNDETTRFLITKVDRSSTTNFYVNIRNEGDLTNPFGTVFDVNRMASDQTMVRQFTFINSISSFRILPQPRPVASMVTELPKGSCIDLSLSGLASNDPNVTYIPTPTPAVPPLLQMHFRDCRREFASDWILPPVNTTGGAVTPNVPLPSELRPVYLTFSPNGLLTSILTNSPGSASLRRIEPQSDVCLFVGRNDQVIRAASTTDLAAAEDTSLRPNLMDPSGYWVRISTSSGIISAAPAQASHIIEDVADFRAGNAPEPIGHLLEDSRSLVFGAELTSQ